MRGCPQWTVGPSDDRGLTTAVLYRAFTVAYVRLVKVDAVELAEARDRHVCGRLLRKLSVRSWERATLSTRFELNWDLIPMYEINPPMRRRMLRCARQSTMDGRNPDRDALRDAIALIRARTDAETDLMLPQVLDANDDGTVSVDPTFVRELAALVTISRDLSTMVDDELLDQYWARKLAATGSGAR
jgi:hypothetical protein